MGGETIKPSYSARVLGLQMTANLDHSYFMKTMKDSLITSIKMRVSNIGRLSKFTTQQKLKELAFGIVFSKLSFGISYWGDCQNKWLQEINAQINRLTRIVCGLGK